MSINLKYEIWVMIQYKLFHIFLGCRCLNARPIFSRGNINSWTCTCTFKSVCRPVMSDRFKYSSWSQVNMNIYTDFWNWFWYTCTVSWIVSCGILLHIGISIIIVDKLFQTRKSLLMMTVWTLPRIRKQTLYFLRNARKNKSNEEQQKFSLEKDNLQRHLVHDIIV